jgi:hypothetical protein
MAAKMAPSAKWENSAYKIRPMRHTLSLPKEEVALVREADRLSYQVEEADRIIKVMGYDSAATKKRDIVKSRLDLVKHLMMNYPITHVKYVDLERLYKLWNQSSSGIDDLVGEIINRSKSKGTPDFVKAATKTRKGYPIIDKFGQVVSLPKAKERKKTLGEFGFGVQTKWVPLLVVAAILLIPRIKKMFK